MEAGYGLKQLADGILNECNGQLKEHSRLAPQRFLEDTLYQALVHEMLSFVRMGRAKLQLYLEDDSRYIAMIKDMPIRSAHRENIARMY